jgi:hypothetical protein
MDFAEHSEAPRLLVVHDAPTGTFVADQESGPAPRAPISSGCPLVRLTHGLSGWLAPWRQALSRVPFAIEFLDGAQFLRNLGVSGASLPLIVLCADGEYSVVLNAGQIRSCRDVFDLASKLEGALEAPAAVAHID